MISTLNWRGLLNGSAETVVYVKVLLVVEMLGKSIFAVMASVTELDTSQLTVYGDVPSVQLAVQLTLCPTSSLAELGQELSVGVVVEV